MEVPEQQTNQVPQKQEKTEFYRKAVFSILDKGGGRSHWMRLGTAFVNRDGSLSVYLDALPTNRKLHIREISNNERKEFNEH